LAWILVPSTASTSIPAPELRPARPEDPDYRAPRWKQLETYSRWADRLRLGGHDSSDGRDYDLHALNSEPISIQDDVRGLGELLHSNPHYTQRLGVPADPELADADAWTVLLELHDDPSIDLHILDGGAFYVLAPVADLATGRMDRLVSVVESS
jgi:hypothetical protein